MSAAIADSGSIQELVTFFLEDEEFGVEVEQVVEVNRDLVWTPIPGAAPAVRGAANLRGHIVTVLDLRRIMDYEERPEEMAHTVIIVHYRDELVGMLVDRIADVIQADKQRLAPPPTNLPEQRRRCLSWVLKEETSLIGLLDLQATLA
ncbi:MAG: chemotaxis protein CheW [Thermodesulfobacteriota bacterium]